MNENVDQEFSKLRAVIYARYSPGPNQRDESIEGQVRECMAVAERCGLMVIETYADKKISGTTDARPAFQRMLRDSDRGAFDVLITWKMDRFARNRYDSAIYKQRLKKNNIKILYAREHIPDGPEGVILESVLEGMAEWYSKNLAQNIRRGLRENALKCRAVGGRVPYGYKLGPQKEFLIDEATAPVVLDIFTRYSDGATIVDIINDLNARGYRTVNGSKFNRSSLHRMFNQKKYIGVYEYEDLTVHDGVPRIIPDDLFYKVRKRVDMNKQFSNGTQPENAPEFSLTGKAFCGNCGSSLIGMSGTSKTSAKHYYYVCHEKRNKKTSCTKKNMKKDDLENLVFNSVIKEVLNNQSIIDQIINAFMAIQAKQKAIDPARELRAELSETRKAIKNIYKAIESGILSAGLAVRLSELEKLESDLECGIAKAEIPAPALTRDQLEFIFYKYSKRNDPDFIRQALDAFVSAVYVYDDHLIVTFNMSNDHSASIDIQDIKADAFNSFVSSSAVAKTPLFAEATNPRGNLEYQAIGTGFAVMLQFA